MINSLFACSSGIGTQQRVGYVLLSLLSYANSSQQPLRAPSIRRDNERRSKLVSENRRNQNNPNKAVLDAALK